MIRGDWGYRAYNAAMMVGAPALAVLLAWRLVRGKGRAGWAERWGRLPAGMMPTGRRRLWCHAASVGEVMAASPVIRAVQSRAGDLDAVMTTITPGGREVAEGYVGKLISGVSFLPFDVAPTVSRYVAKLRPDAFIGMETEIWPNLLHTLRRLGIPAALVNGRISDRSYPKYVRVRWLLRSSVQCYDVILARSAQDAERFRALGADPERVVLAGNVKFDQADAPVTPQEAAALREEFHIPPDAPVWVVGSTRVAEEEQMVWAAHNLATQSVPGLVLVHAPRHIERVEEVNAAMRAAGLAPVRRTQLAGVRGRPRAIILDTFGELGRVYAIGDVALIGNSLTPPGGGQNLLQPLAQGKPVLIGPYASNFRDVVAEAMSHDLAYEVTSARDIAGRLVSLLRDAGGRRRIEGRALELICANRGAAGVCADHIHRLLDRAGDAAAQGHGQG